VYTEYKKVLTELKEASVLAEEESDQEMREMAEEEASGLQEKKETLKKQLKKFLIPIDPLDGKNIIMEIRAGTGGDEAALFAADLYRMYAKFAEHNKWKTEVMNANEIGIGGFKEISFSISGKNVYGNLRYESGVHRVQRVPATESGGRVHTSAVTVAVLPEAEETDIEIKNEDLKIDVFRSSGPGRAERKYYRLCRKGLPNWLPGRSYLSGLKIPRSKTKGKGLKRLRGEGCYESRGKPKKAEGAGGKQGDPRRGSRETGGENPVKISPKGFTTPELIWGV